MIRSFLILSVVITVVMTGSDVAVAQVERTSLTLVVASQAAGPEGAVDLTARLRKADGAAVGSRTIQFLLRVDGFGGRLLPLAARTTDATGMATASFTPRWTGNHQLLARFVGDEQHGPSEVSVVYKAEVAVLIYLPEGRPLAAVSRWVPVGLGVVMVSIWLVLGGVILRIIVGVPREAGRAAQGRIEFPRATTTSRRWVR